MNMLEEAVQFIEGAAVRGSILGLLRITQLCEILGNPQDSLKFIHVAGTNGKGSTAGCIASILRETGYRVGMYYSPAMNGIKDHYNLNGELINDEDYIDCVSKLMVANKELEKQIGEEATQFELETALAFLYFQKAMADIVILETGMGGRDDATNIVRNKLACVISSVSYDHMAILGNTLEEIAQVKAGIITCSCPVVAMDSGDAVMKVIAGQCEKTGSKLHPVRRDDICDRTLNEDINRFTYKNLKGLEIPLIGIFQQENASVAIETINALIAEGYNITEKAIRDGLRKVSWPYRFERINDYPRIYIDGAHNRDAALRLRETAETVFSDKNIIMVVGMFKDKEYEQVLSTMLPMAASVYTLTVPNPSRALLADELKALSECYCKKTVACESIVCAAKMAVDESCALGESSVILAFGSLSYLDDFKTAVKECI